VTLSAQDKSRLQVCGAVVGMRAESRNFGAPDNHLCAQRPKAGGDRLGDGSRVAERVSRSQSEPVERGRGRTVWIALVAGLCATLAKVAAAIVTGSPAMAAEASHSLADNANDIFLLVAYHTEANAQAGARSAMAARRTSGHYLQH
jgi:hypothetical protein